MAVQAVCAQHCEFLLLFVAGWLFVSFRLKEKAAQTLYEQFRLRDTTCPSVHHVSSIFLPPVLPRWFSAYQLTCQFVTLQQTQLDSFTDECEVLDYFSAVVMSDFRKVCVQFTVFSGKVISSGDVFLSELEGAL